jgi:O-antigen/teichoic acid export membrane protein
MAATWSLKRNSFWGVVGNGVPLVVGLVCIPYAMRGMGALGFGIVTLIWSLIGYFGMFDLGIGHAATYEIAKARGAPNREAEIKRIVDSSLLLSLALGTFGFLVILLLGHYLIPFLIGPKPELASDSADVARCIQLTALAIIPTTIFSGQRGVLEGLNKFAAANIARAVVGSALFAAPALAVMYNGGSLTAVGLYNFGVRIAAVAFASVVIRRTVKQPGHDLKRSDMARLLNYGMWTTVSSVIGPLMVYGDRFFVTTIVGAALLPNYAIPQEAVMRLLIIPAALSAALVPHLVSAMGPVFVSVIKRSAILIASVMAFVCVIAAVLLPKLLGIWLSRDFGDNAQVTVLLLLIGLWFNALAQIPYAVLRAGGMPRTIALIHLAELPIYMLIAWHLIGTFGIAGAAAAWSLRAMADCIVLSVAARRWFRYAHPKATI